MVTNHLKARIDALGRRTTLGYGADGRVASITGPAGQGIR
ncbi:hypothetical protein D6833_06450, partial [Candidatus Parcubacteria bacterium]